MTFGFTNNLPCIFDICLVSTAVLLDEDDALLLLSTEKVLELGFLNAFNKSLIKCGLA